MAIKRFWKLYAVICVGLLCMPLLGAIKVAGAVETLESSAVDHSFVAESGDWNTWSSVDQSSADILGEQNMLVASNAAGSHAQAAGGYAPAHSEHELRCFNEPATGGCCVEVRDHGPGVDPAKLGQLTTPFFRGAGEGTKPFRVVIPYHEPEIEMRKGQDKTFEESYLIHAVSTIEAVLEAKRQFEAVAKDSGVAWKRLILFEKIRVEGAEKAAAAPTKTEG